MGDGEQESGRRSVNRDGFAAVAMIVITAALIAFVISRLV